MGGGGGDVWGGGSTTKARRHCRPAAPNAAAHAVDVQLRFCPPAQTPQQQYHNSSSVAEQQETKTSQQTSSDRHTRRNQTQIDSRVTHRAFSGFSVSSSIGCSLQLLGRGEQGERNQPVAGLPGTVGDRRPPPALPGGRGGAAQKYTLPTPLRLLGAVPPPPGRDGAPTGGHGRVETPTPNEARGSEKWRRRGAANLCTRCCKRS